MFSPSSLAALELCPRKFAWDKIDKVPRESNVYATFGIGTHRHIEDYYRHGVMPDISTPEGNCAVALLSHLPPPQPGMRIEEHRIVGRFHGYPDLTLENRVWDHKTTSDLKWAKKPEELATDLQCAIYAHFVMVETGAPGVYLQWNYVTRHKPRVLPVIATLTASQIAPTIDRAHVLADLGDHILDARTPALDLPPNPAACDAYGGCVHRARCNLSPANRREGLMNMSTAADFLKDMNAKLPPTPPNGAPAGNPWDHLPATHQTATAWYDPARAEWIPKVAAAPPPPPPPPPPPMVLEIPINPPPPVQFPINPPPVAAAPPPPPPPAAAAPPSMQAIDAAPLPPPPVASAPTAAQAPDRGMQAGEAYEQIASALESLAEGFRALSTMVGPSDGTRKPGRPKGSKNLPKA